MSRNRTTFHTGCLVQSTIITRLHLRYFKKTVSETILQISPERKSLKREEVVALKKPSVPLKVFDDRTIKFLDALSKAILSSHELNRIAEIAALGFWLRNANISRFIKENSSLIENKNCN